MSVNRVYLDACCFIELAAYKVGFHKLKREEDVRFLDRVLKAAFDGKLEVYTSTLSVAECRYVLSTADSKKILTDEIKRLFQDLLTSGQFVILVQDSVLVAERARNLYWVHQLNVKGPDAIHIASALEMSCDEFLTFDENGPFKQKTELEALGLIVKPPRLTASLAKVDSEHAKDEAIAEAQGDLLADLEESPDPSAGEVPALPPATTTNQSTGALSEQNRDDSVESLTENTEDIPVSEQYKSHDEESSGVMATGSVTTNEAADESSENEHMQDDKRPEELISQQGNDENEITNKTNPD